MDNELFELCKEVYKRLPEWKDFPDDHDWITERNVIGYKRDGIAPLYTSDYLLEKLPDIAVGQFNDEWLAESGRDAKGSDYGQAADTPLKALLKLTIALHESGEIK